jgi:hypothetical protein
MGQQSSAINEKHRTFIEAQKIFFVASAAPRGRVNVSPKGMATLRVLATNEVAYLDCTGSGSETRAHLLASDDQRLTIKSRTTLSAPIPAMAPFAFVGRVCRRAALPCLFRRRILLVGTGLDGSSLTSRGERTEVKRPAAANKLLADRWHRLHCQAPRY